MTLYNFHPFQVFMFCIHHYRKHRRKEVHEALLLRTPGVERRAAHEALLLNPGWWSASATRHFCYLQGSRRKNCTMCSSNPHSSNSRVAINSHSKRQSTNQPIDRSTNSNNQPKLKMLLRDLVHAGRLAYQSRTYALPNESTTRTLCSFDEHILDELVSSNHFQHLTLCSQDGERNGRFSPSHQA